MQWARALRICGRCEIDNSRADPERKTPRGRKRKALGLAHERLLLQLAFKAFVYGNTEPLDFDELGGMVGVKSRQAQRLIRDLADAELVHVEPGGGRHRKNRYWMPVPWAPWRWEDRDSVSLARAPYVIDRDAEKHGLTERDLRRCLLDVQENMVTGPGSQDESTSPELVVVAQNTAPVTQRTSPEPGIDGTKVVAGATVLNSPLNTGQDEQETTVKNLDTELARARATGQLEGDHDRAETRNGRDVALPGMAATVLKAPDRDPEPVPLKVNCPECHGAVGRLTGKGHMPDCWRFMLKPSERWFSMTRAEIEIEIAAIKNDLGNSIQTEASQVTEAAG